MSHQGSSSSWLPNFPTQAFWELQLTFSSLTLFKSSKALTQPQLDCVWGTKWRWTSPSSQWRLRGAWERGRQRTRAHPSLQSPPKTHRRLDTYGSQFGWFKQLFCQLWFHNFDASILLSDSLFDLVFLLLFSPLLLINLLVKIIHLLLELSS